MARKFLLSIIVLACTSRYISAQSNFKYDRVYTANQISNTVSVIDPSQNKFLGDIVLGKPYPNVLNPLYKGEALVHGLRYSPQKKMLAVVSIGTNSVTFISTETNSILGKVYIGRSPHEPTFTPDSKKVWVAVRGEAYVSVIDVNSMQEIKQVPVADGPGMITFTPDGKLAYVCSSFTPEVDVVNSSTYQIVKKIPVTSPFSPNIFTSPDGKFIALTHKDVGKVTVINTSKMQIVKVLNTGPITNHVTFNYVKKNLLMYVTVGGEDRVKVFDADHDFTLLNSIAVDALPHGVWTSPDGKLLYVGLEYADEVQCIQTETMKTTAVVHIGQSPQALVYADNAVSDPSKTANLKKPDDQTATQIVDLNAIDSTIKAHGRLAVRSIGLTDLIEQIFTSLQPEKPYTLALTKSEQAPYSISYPINKFQSDLNGKYSAQSTGLVKKLNEPEAGDSYRHIVLIDDSSGKALLLDDISSH